MGEFVFVRGVIVIGDRVLGSILVILSPLEFNFAAEADDKLEEEEDDSLSLDSLLILYMGLTPDAGLPKNLGTFLILNILAGLDAIDFPSPGSDPAFSWV